jgi:hypothetical protein
MVAEAKVALRRPLLFMRASPRIERVNVSTRMQKPGLFLGKSIISLVGKEGAAAQKSSHANDEQKTRAL